VPLDNYITNIGVDRYQLKLKFAASLKNFVAEDFEVRYVLPEGAT
jgi:hypothetical protein